jgi:MFS family permease
MPGITSRIRHELSFIRGNMLVIIITYGINRFVNAMHSPFKSLYFRELGASPLLIGLMSSAGFIILALIRIPGAYIVDKHGRKKIMVIFTYGVAFSLLIFAFAPDWRFLVVGTAIFYLSHIYQPALQAIEADSTPKEKRGMGYSAIQVLPMIPSIISPVLGGYLVERMGLEQGMRVAFVVAFLGLLTTAILRTLFLKETLKGAEELRLHDLASGFKEQPLHCNLALRLRRTPAPRPLPRAVRYGLHRRHQPPVESCRNSADSGVNRRGAARGMGG